MPVLPLVAWFFAGVFIANTIPHLVAGVMGKPFQSPFAKPPGIGLSSARTNVVWGALNLAVGWWLLARVGAFDWQGRDVLAPALGGFAMCMMLATYFGKRHGGAASTAPD